MRRSAGSSSSGGWSYRRPLSLLLITAYVVMFGWELSAGALESQESIVAAGALYRPPVRDGKLWRLLSAGFTRSAVVYLSGIGGLRDKRIAVVLLAWSGFAILTGLATPLVDHFAHIGGFLGGALGARAVEPVLLQRAGDGR